jgi:predicted ester cyclase
MCVRVAIAQFGAVLGIPTTGKTINAKEMHSFRLIDGQIAEHWAVMAQLGMLRQFGVIPLCANMQ